MVGVAGAFAVIKRQAFQSMLIIVNETVMVAGERHFPAQGDASFKVGEGRFHKFHGRIVVSGTIPLGAIRCQEREIAEQAGQDQK